MAGEKHLYAVVSGGYVSGATALANEIWQFGFRLVMKTGAAFDPIGTVPNDWDVVAASIDRNETAWTITSNWTTEAGVSDLDVGDYLNDQLGPAVEAYIETSSLFSTNVQLRQLRLYPIQAPDGKVIPAPPYAQGSPALLTWKSTQPVGGTSGVMMPPQNSVVVSTRTQQIGRRGRGRWYPPPLAAAAAGTGADAGVITSATRSVAASAAVTMLEAVQRDFGTGGINVRAAVIGAPFTNYALITSVRVGNIVDGQVRRRHQLEEAYTTAAVSV